MTKDSIELITAIVALIIGGAALTVASTALAFIIGLKNSTHQVVWKPLEPEKVEADDSFSTEIQEDAVVLNNPNKRFKNVIKKDEEPFADVSDPAVTSNDW
ncbi:MAG: hypothetical protein H0X02_00750 [Nitrosomonas sp.]|nr:hypothetical protein [Nitrosomonas sp.]